MYKTVFIASHKTDIDGPAHFLEEYLIREKNLVHHISHPLDRYQNSYSMYKKNGELIKKHKRRKLGFINLFIDFLLTLNFARNANYEVFVGANNFDTVIGISANKLYKKKAKIIFYATDLSLERFNNFLLNYIYIIFERFAIRGSDTVISNTKRAEEARVRLGLDSDKAVIMPNGVYLEKPVFSIKKFNKKKFIYVGNVTMEHGIYEFVEKAQSLIDEITVIGQGEGWDDLVKLIKKKKIKNRLYYRKKHSFVIKTLQNFDGYGLAPYNKAERWTYYASPLKIAEYISTGVPVITSTVTELSAYVKNKNLGIVYDKLEPESIRKKIVKFDTKEYHLKSKSFYKEFNYNSLYKKINL